jgi:hypothetical protein
MPNDKNEMIAKTILALAGIFIALPAQNLPLTWTQSYGTYDDAGVLSAGSYALGFGVNNFCLYAPTGDSVAYDERRFDLWARLGLFKSAELEVKYSSPTCAVLGMKYLFLDRGFSGAMKFGIGYMKGTRANYLTDYVYDFYPTLLLSKRLFGAVRVCATPKVIYSIHQRDRQEHTTRPTRHIFQYGFGAALQLGDKFSVRPETNWLWADNEGVAYIVNQFGIGVSLLIR